MVERHFAWFRLDGGRWLGEWAGHVPATVMPIGLIGNARLHVLNEWLQHVQRGISPCASRYEMRAQSWDVDGWENCPSGGAVCLDVTLYGWPVGDFRWAIFDGVDRFLDFRDMRTYLELSASTIQIDVTARSARPIRSTDTKRIADITGTVFESWIDRLRGQFIKRDGRIIFVPSDAGVPEGILHQLTDQNPELAALGELDWSQAPLQERERLCR